MKKYIKDFCLRGLMCASGGPLVLAVVYGCMRDIVLTPGEVSLGIISAAVMAFIAGGINVVYQMERLPLIFAILIVNTYNIISARHKKSMSPTNR